MCEKFINIINNELKTKGAKTACWFIRAADEEECGFEVKIDVTVKEGLEDTFEIEGFDSMPYEENLVVLFSYTNSIPDKYNIDLEELNKILDSMDVSVYTRSFEFYSGALEKHREIIQGGKI